MTSQILEDIMKRIEALESYLGALRDHKPVSDKKFRREMRNYEVRKKILFRQKAK